MKKEIVLGLFLRCHSRKVCTILWRELRREADGWI